MTKHRRHSAENGPHAEAMGTINAATRSRQRAAPRLYLVTPPVESPADVADGLADALNAADIAAVLLRLAPGEDAIQLERIKALRILIQSNGAALILDGHVPLVAPAEADGAHLSGIDDFKAAVGALKPARIAGCGGLATRHDAMLAGESGADYVMFGEPDATGRRPSFDAVLERVDWWTEIFEVPCVAFAGDLAEVAQLARHHAEFIAVSDDIWRDPRSMLNAIDLTAEPVR
jgi:thiamine-phosphate pyrophosphorylase